MKRLILLILLFATPILIYGQANVGKLHYKKIIMDNKGDTLYAQFDGDSVRLVTNKKWAFSPELPGGIETDPIYSSSVAKTITAADTVEWNAKLSSYTETDPIYSSSVAAKITADSTFKWASKEPYLGKPSTDGYILSSSSNGTRIWIAPTSSPIVPVASYGLSTTSWNAGSANNSIFLGVSSGYSTTNASNSIFIGSNAGTEATNASNSVFIGNSGQRATNASYSNFIGSLAGVRATNASNSNFIGKWAGIDATNASYSTFIGSYSGATATNAKYSTFVGHESGSYADSASYSVLLGYRAGYNANGTINSNNIIIGSNISLPKSSTNRMNIGAVLYATGLFSNLTAGVPSLVPASGGRIGVGVISPRTTFEVNGTISVSALNTAPASATDTGVVGEIRITSTYIYVCTATNTWVRTALTTW